MVLRVKLGWKRARRAGAAAGLVWTCFFAGSPANAQAVSSPQESTANFRLLTSEEGRAIVNAAWQQDQPASGSQDCSHVVHEIYVKAGFEYAYASSFDIYTGNENFARVKTPQAGDLIVWPGHVGIVVDPLQHSFYSLVSTGFDAQDYQGLYWKSRGKPRFYRFKVEDSKSVTVAKAAPPARTPKSEGQRGGALVTEKHSTAEYSAANRPPKAASERTAVFHGTRPPEDADAPALTTEVPPSILIVTGKKQPTREEITEGISEYSNAAGNVLRAGDPAKNVPRGIAVFGNPFGDFFARWLFLSGHNKNARRNFRGQSRSVRVLRRARAVENCCPFRGCLRRPVSCGILRSGMFFGDKCSTALSLALWRSCRWRRLGNRHAFRVFHLEAIESRLSPRFPVKSLVILCVESRTHQAIKTVLQWVHHDPDMPRPDNQVSGLRRFHARKILVPRVNVERARIRVLKY